MYLLVKMNGSGCSGGGSRRPGVGMTCPGEVIQLRTLARLTSVGAMRFLYNLMLIPMFIPRVLCSELPEVKFSAG